MMPKTRRKQRNKGNATSRTSKVCQGSTRHRNQPFKPEPGTSCSNSVLIERIEKELSVVAVLSLPNGRSSTAEQCGHAVEG
jgi:hypothetical protein